MLSIAAILAFTTWSSARGGDTLEATAQMLNANAVRTPHFSGSGRHPTRNHANGSRRHAGGWRPGWSARTEDALASTQSQIRALLDSQSEAIRIKDIDRPNKKIQDGRASGLQVGATWLDYYR
jgi:hypothetical protein